MTVAQQRSRFDQSIRTNSPRMPRIRPTAGEEARGTVANQTAAIGAAADGLDLGGRVASQTSRAAGGLSIVANAATGDAAGTANATLDMALSEGASFLTVAEAGPFVGALIGILRGTYQSLNRGDRMLQYLLGISGYIDGLSRLSAEAAFSPHNHTRNLDNEIPSYIMRTGDLFTGRRRRLWIEGMRRTDRVIATMDELRSTDPNEPRYSKQLLIDLVMRSGVTNLRSRGPIRRAVDTFLTREVLRININEQRTALRRWANS